ncbi:MAG: JmjC domain-containing protein [Terriglobales bacterium]
MQLLEGLEARVLFHLPGSPSRFSRVFGWAALNCVLQNACLAGQRVQLVLRGDAISVDRYTSYRPTGIRGGAIGSLLAPELSAHLRKGATLVINALEEVSARVREFVEVIERAAHAPAQANLYAGWQTAPGFRLHRDGHDVLVLQLAGSKRWSIYRPGSQPPEGATPEWEGVLTDGDLLFLPSGWWHVAVPEETPSMHVTVGIASPGGADMAAWFARRVAGAYPESAGPTGWVPNFEAVVASLSSLAQGPPGEPLRRYRADADAASPFRARFNLPWAAMENPTLPPSGSVRWVPSRFVIRDEPAGGFCLACAGREWHFANEAHAMLEMLTDGRRHAIASALDASGAGTEGPAASMLLELASDGIIELTGEAVP